MYHHHRQPYQQHQQPEAPLHGRGRGRASVLPAWMTDPSLAQQAQQTATATAGPPSLASSKQEVSKSSRFDQRPSSQRKRSRSSSQMATSPSGSPAREVKTTTSYHHRSNSNHHHVVNNNGPARSSISSNKRSPPQSPSAARDNQHHSSNQRQQISTTHNKSSPTPFNPASSTILEQESRHHSPRRGEHKDSRQQRSATEKSPVCESASRREKSPPRCEKSPPRRERSPPRRTVEEHEPKRRRIDVVEEKQQQSPPLESSSSSESDIPTCAIVCSRLLELRNLLPEEKRKSMFEIFKSKMVHEDFVFESISGSRYDIDECARRVILGRTALKTSVEVTRRIFIEKDSTTSYCLEAEWQKDGSYTEGRISLYESRNGQLSRYLLFEDSKNVCSPNRKSVTFNEFRECRPFSTVQRYLIKKGVSPSVICYYTDCVSCKSTEQPLGK